MLLVSSLALFMAMAPTVQAITSDDYKCMTNNTCQYQKGDNVQACGSTSDSGAITSADIPGSDNQEKAFNYFMDNEGLSDIQSAAIVGNLMQESGINPKSNQAGGAGMGIAQWDQGGRWANLLKFASSNGLQPFDLVTQLQFMSQELHGKPPAGDYSAVLAKLKQQTDIVDATGFFMGTSAVSDIDSATADFIAKHGKVGGYENPGTPALDNRIANAKSVLDKYGSGGVSGSNASCGGGGSVDCNPDTSTAVSSSNLSEVRQKVVCIARGELAKWESGEMGPGGSNLKYIQTGVQEEWCADFMSWIYKEANYPVTGSMSNWRQAGAEEMMNMPPVDKTKFTTHSPGGYVPVPGDMVVYSYSHINMVVSVNVNKKTMTVIGGNQGNIHANDQSLVSQYDIHGFTGNDIEGYVSPTQ